MRKDTSKTYLYLIMVLLLGLLLAGFIQPLMEGLENTGLENTQKLKKGNKCSIASECESNACVIMMPGSNQRICK
jgi:hypothetical protein